MDQKTKIIFENKIIQSLNEITFLEAIIINNYEISYAELKNLYSYSIGIEKPFIGEIIIILNSHLMDSIIFNIYMDDNLPAEIKHDSIKELLNVISGSFLAEYSKSSYTMNFPTNFDVNTLNEESLQNYKHFTFNVEGEQLYVLLKL